jgi:hypothetical protein
MRRRLMLGVLIAALLLLALLGVLLRVVRVTTA